MCEKAKEIQKLAPDFFTRIHHKNNIFTCTNLIGNSYFYCIDTFGEEDKWGAKLLISTKSIWLPTQEQLCEIVFPSSDRGFVMKLAEIYNWLHKENRKDKRAYRWLKSWNELWLAFVMKEKYNKEWDGKKWK